VRRLERIEAILAQAGHCVTAVPTAAPGAAASLAREKIATAADLIIACGGDGTINEIAQGMVGSPVPLAILPAGTANVLANEMGLGSGLESAARSLATWEPHRIAAGRICNSEGASRYFLMMAGVGLDARIVFDLNAALKRRWGKLAYWMAGLTQLGRPLEQFEVEIDGRTYRAGFALFARVRNYAGDLEIARRVTLLDDTFEVVLFEGRRPLRYLLYLGAVVTHRLYGLRGITMLRARSARFLAPAGQQAHIQVDGEYIGTLPGEVEFVPGAITLLIPPTYAARGS